MTPKELFQHQVNFLKLMAGLTLTPTSKLAFISLSTEACNAGSTTIEVNITDLAADLNATYSTTHKSMEALEKVGLVTAIDKTQGKVSKYKISNLSAVR